MGELILTQAVLGILLCGLFRIWKERKSPCLPPLGVLVYSEDSLDYVEGCQFFLEQELRRRRIRRPLLFLLAQPGGETNRIMQILADKGRIIAWEINGPGECRDLPVFDLTRSVRFGLLRQDILDFTRQAENASFGLDS